MHNPENLRYSKTHEWVRLDGEEAVVGITDHAQSELGDVVYVELPDVGTEYGADEECGMIDSAKTTSPLISPIAGTVTRINEKLVDQPELVNQSPYENGWMFALKPNDPADVENLMTAGGYEEFVASET